MAFFREFINANIRISKWFVPSLYLKDGNSDFMSEVTPSYLRQGIKIHPMCATCVIPCD